VACLQTLDTPFTNNVDVMAAQQVSKCFRVMHVDPAGGVFLLAQKTGIMQVFQKEKLKCGGGVLSSRRRTGSPLQQGCDKQHRHLQHQRRYWLVSFGLPIIMTIVHSPDEGFVVKSPRRQGKASRDMPPRTSYRDYGESARLHLGL
jgi:hypothetical protein